MTSAYEKARLARIEANEAFLAELDVGKERRNAEAPLVKAKQSKARAREVNRKRRAREAEQNPVPRRKSSRLAGNPAEGMYVDSVSRGKVTIAGLPSSMTKEVRDLVSTTPAANSRRERFNEEILNLEIEGDDEAHGKAFFESLKKTSSDSDDKNGNAEDSEEGLRESEMDYAAKLSALECQGSEKVVQSRGYAVAFHPKLPILCAGDRDGQLGLLKIHEDAAIELQEEDIVQFKPHVSTINVVEYADTSLFTASYDGTARKMDLGAPGRFELLYKSDEEHGWLQHAEITHQGNNLVIGFSDGYVMSIDARAPTESKPAWSFQAHDKKTQTVSLDHTGNFLCTSSLDRSIRLWDVRKASSSRKPPSPICTFEDRYSINSCKFNATGDRLIAVGQSNKLHLFMNPQKSTDGELKPSHSLAHDNQTGRYLAVFHANWDPKNPSAFICGSMSKPRRVEVFSTDGGKIKRIMNLAGDAIGSVQSRNAFHPNQNMIACLNASGRVSIFR
mmetsp:Transcript_4061/g.8735  ORF Transcript_4061/g.8735 Transcript_4061/m.8735 type:complete len:504 (+) Transcript_4061:155-1666(+)|eukprot:CAMPEP_0171492556 /NCGR_PEP_ID=MMETSP0958-20121227/4476_1 /TAXON_ID=87120 /ORGANISM="Aurantiochytrium limacinum, Strain ATCCMYA-1381" /LENGTH=503 /DNA_ID=CAMNT_0012026089 /DNA_START=83 /DNA_END=1594 /DNA_ORIENTATION=-